MTPYYPPFTVGGTEESAFVLARALRARGHDVLMAAPDLGPPAPGLGVDVMRVPTGLRLPDGGGALRPRQFDRPLVQARLAWHLARALRRADLMHVQHVSLLPAGWIAARAASRPIVTTIRDLAAVCSVNVSLLQEARVPADCSLRKLHTRCIPEFASLYGGGGPRTHAAAGVGFLTARGRAALLKRCDAVVSLSRDLAALHVEAGLADAATLHTIPNIAELPEANGAGAPDGPFLLYAGKVSHGKGMRHLLEAIALARAEEPDVRVVVAGSADARWAERLRAAEGVEYVGRVDRARLASLYRRARFGVIPSIWPEPLSRAALEAAYSGRAVVATRAGGLPEAVVDGVTGVLVPPRDPRRLADALVGLWRDEARAEQLGANARDHAARSFSAGTVAERVERDYAGVACASRPCADRRRWPWPRRPPRSPASRSPRMSWRSSRSWSPPRSTSCSPRRSAPCRPASSC